MKKSLAIITSMLLLLSSLACGIVLTSAEDADSYTTGFYFDFSDSSKYAGWKVTKMNQLNSKQALLSGNASYGYDATEGALKLTGDGSKNDGGNDGWGSFLWMSGIPDAYNAAVTGNDVLALKVKLTNADSTYIRTDLYAKNGAANANSPYYLKNEPVYEKTTDWQLVLIDLSSENYGEALAAVAAKNATDGTASNWYTMKAELLPEGSSDSVYVKWAGIFKNEAEAKLHYMSTTPAAPGGDGGTSGGNDGTPGGTGGTPGGDGGSEQQPDDGLTTDFFFDLSTEEKYNALTAEADSFLVYGKSGSVTTNYDTTNNALKMTYNGNAVNTFSLRLGFNRARSVNIGDCKVLALKLKIGGSYMTSNIDYPYGPYLHSASLYSNGTAHIIFDGGTIKQHYDLDATNWQLVLIEVPENTGATGVWDQALVYMDRLGGYLKSNSLTFWLQWAGLFTDETTAQKYYDATTEKDDSDKDDGPVNDSKFFYSLNTQEKYDRHTGSNCVIADGNTKIAFDTEMSAVKVTVKETYDGTDSSVDSQIGKVGFIPRNGLTEAMADYPYFAAKVKLADPETNFGYMYVATKALGSGFLSGASYISTYDGTDDWQIVIIRADENISSVFTGDWKGVLYGLLPIGTHVEADQTLGWIEWAGSFKSVDEIWSYAGVNPDAVEAPTPIFWDFALESTMNYHVTSVGDTAVSYDDQLKAMKVEAKDMNGDGLTTLMPASFSLGKKMSVESGVAMEEYPIFALRVKLADRDLMGGMLSVASTNSKELFSSGDISSASVEVASLKYATTTNWQTIIIDYTDNPVAQMFLGGDWISMDMEMVSSVLAMAGDTVYVKWAGAFASVKDVEAYVAQASIYETGNDDTLAGDEGDDGTTDDNGDEDKNDDKNDGKNDDENDGQQTVSPVTGESVTAIVVALLLAAVAALVLFAGRKRTKTTD